MNKADLVEAIAKHFDGNRAEAARALNAVVATITDLAASGEKVSITGFGAFDRSYRGDRMVRNPATGERRPAGATYVPRFRAGTNLKARIAASIGTGESAGSAKASSTASGKKTRKRA